MLGFDRLAIAVIAVQLSLNKCTVMPRSAKKQKQRDRRKELQQTKQESAANKSATFKSAAEPPKKAAEVAAVGHDVGAAAEARASATVKRDGAAVITGPSQVNADAKHVKLFDGLPIVVSTFHDDAEDNFKDLFGTCKVRSPRSSVLVSARRTHHRPPRTTPQGVRRRSLSLRAQEGPRARGHAGRAQATHPAREKGRGDRSADREPRMGRGVPQRRLCAGPGWVSSHAVEGAAG